MQPGLLTMSQQLAAPRCVPHKLQLQISSCQRCFDSLLHEIGTSPSPSFHKKLPNCQHRHRLNLHCLQRMGEVPGAYIAGALIPGLIITVLFYFDHSVSSQLAQASIAISSNIVCVLLFSDIPG